MDALKGKNFILRVLKDGIFKPVACATSTTINVNRELKEATKPSKSTWKRFYSGMMGYSISTDGLCTIGADVVSAMDLLAMMVNGDAVQWAAFDEVYPDYFMTGYVLMNDESFVSPAEGPHTFSFSAVGDGEIKTNNPYLTQFVQVQNDFFLTEGETEFIVERITGDLPDYM